MSDGEKKRPSETDSVDVNWVVDAIGAPFPTWVEKQLYEDEFVNRDNHEVTANHLIAMFNDLGKAVDKAFAGDRVAPTIHFKYWRKLSDKATKLKPQKLKATLYQHTDYGRVWMLVEYA